MAAVLAACREGSCAYNTATLWCFLKKDRARLETAARPENVSSGPKEIRTPNIKQRKLCLLCHLRKSLGRDRARRLERLEALQRNVCVPGIISQALHSKGVGQACLLGELQRHGVLIRRLHGKK